MLATVIESDFPFEELARFDSWADASAAGHDESQIWSVTIGETDEGEDVFCYGPPHHFVNHLYHVATAERHDGNTYYEET